jgi:uncharacterized protein YlaI
MARVSDYGGHAHDRGHGDCTKLKKEYVLSFLCDGCHHRFYLTHPQRNRMKAGARCPKCGGLGEETEASVKRRLGCHKTDIPKMLGKLDAFKDHTGRVVETPDLSRDNQCRFCHRPFRSSIAMKIHMEETHGFFEEF